MFQLSFCRPRTCAQPKLLPLFWARVLPVWKRILCTLAKTLQTSCSLLHNLRNATSTATCMVLVVCLDNIFYRFRQRQYSWHPSRSFTILFFSANYASTQDKKLAINSINAFVHSDHVFTNTTQHRDSFDNFSFSAKQTTFTSNFTLKQTAFALQYHTNFGVLETTRVLLLACFSCLRAFSFSEVTHRLLISYLLSQTKFLHTDNNTRSLKKYLA